MAMFVHLAPESSAAQIRRNGIARSEDSYAFLTGSFDLMQPVIPEWLHVAWICLSPLGLTFAGRIAWEKTVWTINRGPQMVGFSLMHIHPGFFIVGILSSYLLILWLVPDTAMVILALLVAVAIIMPDTLFANSH